MKRRLEDEIANAGAPPHGDQVSPLEEDSYIENAPANPHSLIDENIRTAFLKMSQSITTQAQAVTAQVHAMTAQEN